MSEMLMAIFLVYSTSGITFGKKVCRELKIAAILKILKYHTQLQFPLRYEKIVPNYAQKSIFMMMTSSMTSQGGLKVGPVYSFINEIVTFFMITKQRAKISSLNFLCICIIIALWGWFSRDVLPMTCWEHGPPSIATVHFSKFPITTNILFN